MLISGAGLKEPVYIKNSLPSPPPPPTHTHPHPTSQRGGGEVRKIQKNQLSSTYYTETNPIRKIQKNLLSSTYLHWNKPYHKLKL